MGRPRRPRSAMHRCPTRCVPRSPVPWPASPDTSMTQPPVADPAETATAVSAGLAVVSPPPLGGGGGLPPRRRFGRENVFRFFTTAAGAAVLVIIVAIAIFLVVKRSEEHTSELQSLRQ